MMEPTDEEIGFPRGNSDERELLLNWLAYLRGAVLRKANGLDDQTARWTPDGKLLSILGIVNHLTNVEWRWISGGMQNRPVSKEASEYTSDPELTLASAIQAYLRRAENTDSYVRQMALDTPCSFGVDRELRWVLLHLINETARHAGHADATRELLDGTTGE
ncbi:MAG: DUF664 domain-containing protein [Chloroflexota bacterium]